MEKATEDKPFEINIRVWEDWPDALLEDSVQGEWKYIPVPALIEEIKKMPLIQVIESEEGIKIMDNMLGRSFNGKHYYLLSGRREDWQKDSELEEFEIIKKVNSVRGWSGREETFDKPRYIDYGVVGLYTHKNVPLMAGDVLSAVGVVNSLVTAVIELSRVYLKDKK